MKVLITGINGFVGRHLARELNSKETDVWGIDTSSASENVSAVNILDRESIHIALNHILPEIIIHLAAIANVDHSNLSLIYDVNFHGTVNLLNACVSLDKRPKFIFVSSSQVYGNVSEDKLSIDEFFQINPVNHYGASKAAAEMSVKAFGAEYGIEYAIARPFNHTGPGQTDKFVVPKLITAFNQRKKTIELGNIHTIRDFTDVRDVAAAYRLIIENFTSGETYNIASGKGIRISDIILKLKKISGHDMEIIKKEFLVRGNEIQSAVGNNEKIKNMIGWSPSIQIDDTLRDMLNSK